jgi:exodeoxyribonuclease-5
MDYFACSYTGSAALIMRTRGFPTAKSIHSTLYETVEIPDESDTLAARFGARGIRKVFRLCTHIQPVSLFFIDEAYMVPKKMVQDILSFGIKTIVCGDTNQLPPIGDDPGFLVSGKVHHLTQLMRQAEDNPIVYLSNRAIKGLPIHLGMYGNDVLVCRDIDFIPQMIGYSDVILCGTNKTRSAMNTYVRNLAGFYGNIPHYGERVICRKNNWDVQVDGIALANGLSGTVVNEPSPSSYNQYGDFLINFKPDLANRVFYNVPVSHKYFIATPDEKAYMKSCYESKYITGEFFDFAYCLTTHISQGSEYDNVLFMEEYMRPEIMNAIKYTAITRARKKLIYIVKTNKYFQIKGLNEFL